MFRSRKIYDTVLNANQEAVEQVFEILRFQFSKVYTENFYPNGKMIGALRIPTVVVQSGCCRTRTLGGNACHFFKKISKTTLQRVVT